MTIVKLMETKRNRNEKKRRNEKEGENLQKPKWRPNFFFFSLLLKGGEDKNTGDRKGEERLLDVPHWVRSVHIEVGRGGERPKPPSIHAPLPTADAFTSAH